jgi:hypothetical protein
MKGREFLDIAHYLTSLETQARLAASITRRFSRHGRGANYALV